MADRATRSIARGEGSRNAYHYPLWLNWIIALLRRFADLGPDWFSLLTWLPFNFVLRRGEQDMGTYKRVLGKFRDRYMLELAPEIRGSTGG